MTAAAGDGLGDRVALVTGGGTGIGAAISARLADLGATVVVAQRTRAAASDAVRRLAAPGRALSAVAGDLGSAARCRAVVATTVRRHGRIDILVNNAAITGPPALSPLLDSTDDHLDRVVDVNLKAAIRCTREAARDMAPRRSGVIVNISSVGARAAQRHATAYVAAKAGLDGLTRGAAFELAGYGIRVVGVAPGDIDVDATGGDGVAPAEADDRGWARRTPLGRRGVPDDVAALVAFLCGDDASFITGETVLVDGGWLSY